MGSSRHSQPAFGLASFARLLAYSLLFLQLASVAEAGKLRNICKSLNCFSKSDNELPPPPTTADKIVCPNPHAPKTKEGWHITGLTQVPTVEQIYNDIILCGIVTAEGAQVMFYSFGAGLTAAKEFQSREKDLHLHHINDHLPEVWYDAQKENPIFHGSDSVNAMVVMVARHSQALAKAARGDVYLIARDANIYTVPHADPSMAWRGEHNVWSDYEFRTLQKNEHVRAIYTVSATTFAIDRTETGSWIRGGHGEEAENDVNADHVTIETIKAAKASATSQPSGEACEAGTSGTQKRGVKGHHTDCDGKKGKTTKGKTTKGKKGKSTKGKSTTGKGTKGKTTKKSHPKTTKTKTSKKSKKQ